MRAYRPEPVVKALTVVLSFTYYTTMGLAVLVLVGSVALRLLAADSPDWMWGLEVPASLLEHDATVRTSWGSARIEVEDVRAHLRMPIAMMPWWLFALLLTHLAVVSALVLLFLHQLRAIFHRVREGDPFDAGNAVRLQRLGWLLGGFAVVRGVAELVTSAAVRGGLASDSISVPLELNIDLRLIFIAFVLGALGEIFNRGTELETEQSLVV
jgi:hypothetical protein